MLTRSIVSEVSPADSYVAAFQSAASARFDVLIIYRAGTKK